MTQPDRPIRKVTRGAVGLSLDAVGADKRARGNAKVFAFPAAVRGLRQFTYAGIDIVIRRNPSLEPMANGHVALRVDVDASRGGVATTVSNPLLFVNPPIMVPGPGEGELIEDIAEAFRQMVGEAVRGSWRP